jgi:hypothetical protein
MWVAGNADTRHTQSEDAMSQFQAEPRSRKVSRPPAVDDAPQNDADYDEDDDPRARMRTALARVDPFVRDQIATHPYRTVGAAVLLGFAIGGGFSSRVARFLAVAAARYAARILFRDIAATALGTGRDARSDDELFG